jgi:iron complex transport system permease protein
LTSSSVSVVGIIGWIGLIAPHIARFSIGADNSKVIPVSVLFGSVFLIIADDLARASTSGEIPIGILTSLIGAPIFAFIYRKIYKVLR